MKNMLLSKSGQLLKYLKERDIDSFNTQQATEALPSSSAIAIRELLRYMTKRGLLMRLKRNLYYVIPYEYDAATFTPNWHIIASKRAQETDHYIGYYSALQIHGLITQPSLKEQVVVARQITPSNVRINSVPVQFIFHNKKHFFGIKDTWIDRFNKVPCSDLEKTIIDCLYKPNYAGGIVEIARAIHLSHKNINYLKLVEYIERFKSQAVIKRLGFLIETMELKTEIVNILLHKRSDSYVILDPELPRSGKLKSRWRVQQNIDSETIRSNIYT